VVTSEENMRREVLYAHPASFYYNLKMIQFFPDREILCQIGMINIRWYGVMYVVAFGLAVFVLPRLQRWRGLKFSKEQWLEIVAWLAIGVIVGGRVGYLIIYNWTGWMSELEKIFYLNQGGMSAHGGILGVVIVLSLINKRIIRGKFKAVADLLVVPAALGLALGRVGNFVNQELYGTVTDVPWGVMIPEVMGLRHPWPWYEAVWLVVIAWLAYGWLRQQKPTGTVGGLFLIWYGMGRFLLEEWREPEWKMVLGLSPGQWWSIGLVLVGMMILGVIWRRIEK
jgi:phosphatidylglycerol---prolipoprotein diacylglyceryl transferase